jgi:hypothetical protein
MQTLTIKLTDAIYSQLRRAAELAHQPLDVVVEQSDALRREADVLTFRKGYAAVLLKRHGQRLPSLTELSQAA